MKKITLFLFVLISSISFLQIDCKDKPPIVPPDDKPDTTSHNFTFTTYTFGGTGGSSYFKDVAIINDSDIWVVGGIFTSPDTTYNAAHWDGKNWKLIRLNYNTNSLISSIRGIFVINPTNIYLAAGGIFYWNGSSQQTELVFSRLSLPDANATIEKIWGASGNNIFGVGNAGTIVHYNGITWTKQESGTTIDLRDVWGSADGKTVWACGYTNDNSKSVLLKYDGTTWQTVWTRQGTATLPFGDLVTSLWASSSLYTSGTRGVFRVDNNNVDSAKKQITLPWFPYRIRGSAENNIATTGDEGMIWHYNGATWKELNIHSGQPLYSVTISKNMIVACGVETSIGFGAALIYIGRH